MKFTFKNVIYYIPNHTLNLLITKVKQKTLSSPSLLL